MTQTAKNYARTFAGASGAAVLEHLRRITIERTLGPNASDAELRWVEAQRALVRQIETLTAQGKSNDNK
ncbi:MAG: hypothetical protein J6R22_00070 [Alphaproteobacteria bacterium]|nr:hypothetical protein [Alphaproteobacteria bacterium]